MWDVYSEAWKWYPLCTKVPRSLHKFALCWWLSIDNGKVWDIVIQVPLWKDITWYVRFVGSVFPDNWGLLLNIYNLRLCCLYSCFENITILCKHVTPKIPKSINRYLKKKVCCALVGCIKSSGGSQLCLTLKYTNLWLVSSPSNHLYLLGKHKIDIYYD